MSMENQENTTKTVREYDDLFKYVKSFGRYQKIVFFSSCCLVMLTSCQFAVLLFVYGTPNFHCDTGNSTCPPSKCCNNCTNYVFDGPFKSIASEFNLICDKAYIGATLQSCFFAGMLLGAFGFGMVSDSFGRKKATYMSVAILILASVGSVFAGSTTLLGILRFLIGVGAAGNQTSHFTFVLEFLGPEYRSMVSSLYQAYFGLGFHLTCMTAYFIRDWRPVVLITSVPGLLLFLLVRVYPESPRWLVSKHRLDEAHNILMKFGSASQKPVEPSELRTAIEDVRKAQHDNKKDDHKVYTPLDLVRTPKLRRRSMMLAINWFSVSFLSNAFLLYTGSLPGSIYLNFTIINSLYPLAVILTWTFVKRAGRRLTHAGILIIAGTLCLTVLAIPDDKPMSRTWVFVTSSTITSGLWITIFLVTSELFPTVLRSTAVGSGYTVGRVGAMLSPYVAIIGQLPGITITLPLTILGALAVATSISSLWLPETLNATMHQTIEEEEKAEDDYSLPCCRKTKQENMVDGVSNVGRVNQVSDDAVTTSL